MIIKFFRLILVTIIVGLGLYKEKSWERWQERVVDTKESYREEYQLFPKWRFINNFATPERQEKILLFYYRKELEDDRIFMPKQFVCIPSYFFSPSKVYVNVLAEIESVDLVYTEDHSYEELRSEMKKLGVWKDFDIVQRYGDFQLLERKGSSP